MALRLESIVPWGRSLDEYTRMFNLSTSDHASRILDCGGGPASFNAELYSSGNSIVSIDPIFRFSTDEIARRIDESCPLMIGGVEENVEAYVWREFESPRHLGEARMATMRRFLSDFPKGSAEGRYVAGDLPSLPFEDSSFDLALSSHFLFSYSTQLSAAFHVKAIEEMCRVAAEVRIFPIIDISDLTSVHLEPVCRRLEHIGYSIEIERAAYEFQVGGNELLRIVSSARIPHKPQH